MPTPALAWAAALTWACIPTPTSHWERCNRCKRPFERIWRDKLTTRSQAYAWLAAELQIMPPECHFGLFDVDRCERAKRICDEYLEAIYTSSARWG